MYRWCAFFSESELEMIGYYLDMKAYWKKGEYNSISVNSDN